MTITESNNIEQMVTAIVCGWWQPSSLVPLPDVEGIIHKELQWFYARGGEAMENRLSASCAQSIVFANYINNHHTVRTTDCHEAKTNPN